MRGNIDRLEVDVHTRLLLNPLIVFSQDHAVSYSVAALYAEEGAVLG
jgi:hypothetical protein